jgi:putative transposase
MRNALTWSPRSLITACNRFCSRCRSYRRWQGRPAGQAIPHVIGRHAHPKARPEQPAPPARPTGIDYIGLLDTGHDTRLAGGAISFAGLSDPAGPGQLPGQMTTGEARAGVQEER